jgi:curli production assembly/transport component CsgF
MNRLNCAVLCSMMIGICSPALADLIYKPINPSFGGDPYNTNHLQGLAASQNQYKQKAEKTASQSTSERFLSMLQSRLYSGLASQVADAIFGPNAQQSGTIVFDDQTISFANDGSSIHLTVIDASTGKTTTILIPTL